MVDFIESGLLIKVNGVEWNPFVYESLRLSRQGCASSLKRGLTEAQKRSPLGTQLNTRKPQKIAVTKPLQSLVAEKDLAGRVLCTPGPSRWLQSCLLDHHPVGDKEFGRE